MEKKQEMVLAEKRLKDYCWMKTIICAIQERLEEHLELISRENKSDADEFMSLDLLKPSIKMLHEIYTRLDVCEGLDLDCLQIQRSEDLANQ